MLARLELHADIHSDWVKGEAEREALVTTCVEGYFECEINQIPESKLGLYYIMQEFIQIFLFDHCKDVVPEGRNRWEYLVELWRTGDGEYSLDDCLGCDAKINELDSKEREE